MALTIVAGLGITAMIFCQPGIQMLLCRLKANRIFDPAGFKERFPYSFNSSIISFYRLKDTIPFFSQNFYIR